MSYFFNQVVNGLGIGSIFALVALGYTMVYGIVKLINFAHGDVIMISSYFILSIFMHTPIPFFAAILISMLLCGAIGVIIERVAYKPLRRSTRISALITAIGVSIFLQNLFMNIYSPTPRPFPSPIPRGSVRIGDVLIPYNMILAFTVSVVLMIILTVFVKKTRIGKAMRAVSEDAGAASLMGVDVNTTISITFFIGSALAAIAGALYSMTYNQLTHDMGAMFGLQAFIAAVLGGIGTIPGAMIGGFILGLVNALAVGYISSAYAEVIVFSLLIIVLLFKPSGILGKNIKEKV